MAMAGLDPPRLDGIVLTHADSDHIRNSWRRTLERDEIPVHIPVAHRYDAEREAVPRILSRVFSGSFEPAPGVRFDPYVCPHDGEGSSAFRISCGDASLGWATDLGRVPEGLLEHLDGVDALAIESNYDRGLQENSGRPDFLVRRITGGRGHLSNRECLDAVKRLTSRQDLLNPMSHIVLLHLSRDCNRPELIRALWAREAPELLERLVISAHDRPAGLLHIGPGAGSTDQGVLFA